MQTDKDGFISCDDLDQSIDENARFCVREKPYTLGTNDYHRDYQNDTTI